MKHIQKIKNFVNRHNEAIVVALLATLALHVQAKNFKTEINFLVHEDEIRRQD